MNLMLACLAECIDETEKQLRVHWGASDAGRLRIYNVDVDEEIVISSKIQQYQLTWLNVAEQNWFTPLQLNEE